MRIKLRQQEEALRAKCRSGVVRQDPGCAFREHFGAYSSQANFKGILAEYIVNNVETLPSCYSTAELRGRYRERFSAVVSARNRCACAKP